MKKLLTTIVTTVLLLSPFCVSASYVIYLKDGRKFVTGQYSEEGNQIKFRRYGGIIGIQKDLVREIAEVEDMLAEKEKPESSNRGLPEIAKKEDSEIERTPGVEEIEKDGSQSKGKGKKTERNFGEGEKPQGEENTKKIDIAYYKREKKAFEEKYQAAREKLEKSRRTRDKALRREAKEELKEIRKLQKELEVNLKRENDGIIPDWWKQKTKLP